MKKFIAFLLALLLLPVFSCAESNFDLQAFMKKFGYGWEYGEFPLATSPFKLRIPDDMWPVEPQPGITIAAQTEKYEKTGGKIIEGVFGHGMTAHQLTQMQKDALIDRTQSSYDTIIFDADSDPDAFDHWLEQLMAQNVTTYIETLELPFGGETIHTMLMLENLNRRDAINTTAVFAFDYAEGERVYVVSYILIESADPTQPAEKYTTQVENIRQQLIDFVGTVLLEK